MLLAVPQNVHLFPSPITKITIMITRIEIHPNVEIGKMKLKTHFHHPESSYYQTGEMVLFAGAPQCHYLQEISVGQPTSFALITVSDNNLNYHTAVQATQNNVFTQLTFGHIIDSNLMSILRTTDEHVLSLTGQVEIVPVKGNIASAPTITT